MLSKTGSIRTCLYFNECGRKEVYNGIEWQENWCKSSNNYICKKHYMRLFYIYKTTSEQKKRYNDKSNPINNPKNNPRHLSYKGKIVLLKERRLTGRCEWCKKKIGDEYINCLGKKSIIKKTALHHIVYHDDDVLKDTTELCVSCHMKESWKLKKDLQKQY